MSSTAERQQRLKEKRLESGRKLANVWLPVEDMNALKQVFPGPRGGIDWPAVAAAALSGRPRPPAPLPTHDPAEPILYWKPHPFKPMVVHCQGTNRDGSRCQSKPKQIVMVLLANGKKAEFTSCKRHAELFKPHPSVLKSLDV